MVSSPTNDSREIKGDLRSTVPPEDLKTLKWISSSDSELESWLHPSINMCILSTSFGGFATVYCVWHRYIHVLSFLVTRRHHSEGTLEIGLADVAHCKKSLSRSRASWNIARGHRERSQGNEGFKFASTHYRNSRIRISGRAFRFIFHRHGILRL